MMIKNIVTEYIRKVIFYLILLDHLVKLVHLGIVNY